MSTLTDHSVSRSWRPNILYLHSHDTGRFIQPYGHPLRTPALQRFAEQGILFRNAHCISPSCSASRACLLTGAYPHVNGMVGLAHRGSRLREPSMHLASFLRSRGYDTTLVGIQHEANDPRDLGYNTVADIAFPPGSTPEDQDFARADHAANLIRNSPPGLRPFFLSCGFFTTHRASPPGPVRFDTDGLAPQWHHTSHTPQGDPKHTLPPSWLPDSHDVRSDFADFGRAVGRLDNLMGTVLAALNDSPRRGTTLVIVTTDHGIAFPNAKSNLTDAGTGVMLMLRAPGLPSGLVLDSLVTHLDIFPTLCQYAEIAPPGWLAGSSLLPLLNGQPEVHDAVFSHLNYHAAYEPARSVRTHRHRYTRHFRPLAHPVLPNCDDSASKRHLIRSSWSSRPQLPESLHDLTFDPTETSDLSTDPAHADILNSLRTRLDQHMRDQSDPLLLGHVPAPPNLLVNPATAISPFEPSVPANEP
jgi:N-sulfoglucosamine sulfohydrolase